MRSQYCSVKLETLQLSEAEGAEEALEEVPFSPSACLKEKSKSKTYAVLVGATQKCRIDQIQSTQGLDTDEWGATLPAVNTENGHRRLKKKVF